MELYEKCYRIRRFERQVEKEFENGTMRGTTHGCIGQEIIPVLVMDKINKDIDYVVGTHRCHGQVLAYTNNSYKLVCEMMGKKDGYVGGIGGSQHIKTGHFLTNGITGGMAVIGMGIAMGIKKTNSEGVVVSFLGDGGFNEGYVQEALNLASLYKVPILFICENNHYAMSTPTERYSSGTVEQRVSALNIKYLNASTTEIDNLQKLIDEAYNFTLCERQPCFLNVETARLCGHSKSDKMEYMSEEEKEYNILQDPIVQLEKKLTQEERNQIQKKIDKEIIDAFERAKQCVEK